MMSPGTGLLVVAPKLKYPSGQSWKLIPTAAYEFVTNIVQSCVRPT